MLDNEEFSSLSNIRAAMNDMEAIKKSTVYQKYLANLSEVLLCALGIVQKC